MPLAAGGAPALPLGASIEATPRQIAETEGLGTLFPPRTRVFLTDVGTADDAAFADAAARLHEAGHVAVPHLPARRFVSHATVASRLAAIATAAPLEEVLVIAGSVASPAGPFASSLDLLESGLLDAHGVRQVAIAGHPEGSPDIAPAAVTAALAAKQAWAHARGVEMFIGRTH